MADDTSYAESAQALFCAMADYLGKSETTKLMDVKKYPDLSSLMEDNKLKKAMDKSYPRIYTHYKGGAKFSLDQITEWLSDPKNKKWYTSTILIAKKMMEEISSIDSDFQNIESANFQNLYYFRGDDEVMTNIETLFKIANEADVVAVGGTMKFGDVNKWSPADIYFGSTKAKNKIKRTIKEYNTPKSKKAFSFTMFNGMMGDLIDSGDLLPLSLKQAAGSVTIKKVNFVRSEEEKYINSLKITNIQWTPYKELPYEKWKAIPKTQRQARDLQVKIAVGQVTGKLKFRHDPSGKKMLAEYVPDRGNAREGQIGSADLIAKVMETLDTTAAAKFKREYDKANLKFKDEMKTLTPQKPALSKINPGQDNKFNWARGNVSATIVMAATGPVLMAFFKSKNGVKFAKLIFEYSTSRSIASGKFVIAK